MVRAMNVDDLFDINKKLPPLRHQLALTMPFVEGDVEIPLILHQVWLGDPPPEHVVAFKDKWIKQTPAFTHFWWDIPYLRILEDTGSLSKTVARVYPLVMKLCYETPLPGRSARDHYVLASDLLRLAILNDFGGVYLDTDMEPGPVDIMNIMRGHVSFVGAESTNTLSNAAMACRPQDVFFYTYFIMALRRIETAIAQGSSIIAQGISGPRLVTNLWKMRRDEFLYTPSALPPEIFYPYHYSEVSNPRASENSVAIHHWASLQPKRDLREVLGD